MVKQNVSEDRVSWEDRFNKPTVSKLRGELTSDAADLFDVARETFKNVCKPGEAVVWKGDCWKWTLEFRSKRKGMPLAVIIPNPNDLQIAIPVDPEFVRAMWKRQMKKSVREGLELAAKPYDTEWCIWYINTKPMLEEVIELVKQKVKFTPKKIK